MGSFDTDNFYRKKKCTAFPIFMFKRFYRLIHKKITCYCFQNLHLIAFGTNFFLQQNYNYQGKILFLHFQLLRKVFGPRCFSAEKVGSGLKYCILLSIVRTFITKK